MQPPPPGPVLDHANPSTQLWIGDCNTILIYPFEKKFNLIFADPPFNIGVDYGNKFSDKMSIEHYGTFTFDWISSCLSHLSENGSIWIHVPDQVVLVVLQSMTELSTSSKPIDMMNWVIWHYRFGQHIDNGFINSKTHLLHFRWLGSTFTWNPDAILVESDRSSRYNDQRTHNKDRNRGKRLPLDVWRGPNMGRVQGNNAERRPLHPNQLPELMLARIILSCSNEGDLVFDPFCGSGTTSTVARALNRRSITCEINPDFASSAWQRITEVGMIRSTDELQNLYD